MPRLRDETRLARRQRFIDAAWTCARSRGFRDVSLDAICAQAGVTKGAFYAHFGSKHDLLEAVIDDDAATICQLIDELEQEALEPMGRLHRLTRALVERGADSGRMQVRADLWTLVLGDPAVRARVDAAALQQRRVLRRWIEEAIAAGQLREVPANALASMLLALSDGLILHYAINPAAFHWANVSRAIDALLDGLRP